MGRKVIIHNSHDKKSRDFVAANSGNDVIDWYSGDPKVQSFMDMGITISHFPTVVDLTTKASIIDPANMAQAIDTLDGVADKNQAIATCSVKVDVATKELIEKGFEYLAMEFKSSDTDQINYTSDMQTFTTIQYPYNIKKADGTFWSCPNQGAYAGFYAAYVASVRAARQSGWDIKKSLEDMTLDQLKAFIDPRTLLQE